MCVSKHTWNGQLKSPLVQHLPCNVNGNIFDPLHDLGGIHLHHLDYRRLFPILVVE